MSPRSRRRREHRPFDSETGRHRLKRRYLEEAELTYLDNRDEKCEVDHPHACCDRVGSLEEGEDGVVSVPKGLVVEEHFRALESGEEFRQSLLELFRAVQCFHEITSSRYAHGDVHNGNFVYYRKRDDERSRAVLVDFDRICEVHADIKIPTGSEYLAPWIAVASPPRARLEMDYFGVLFVWHELLLALDDRRVTRWELTVFRDAVLRLLGDVGDMSRGFVDERGVRDARALRRCEDFFCDAFEDLLRGLSDEPFKVIRTPEPRSVRTISVSDKPLLPFISRSRGRTTLGGA
jgi:hypothetical protein